MDPSPFLRGNPYPAGRDVSYPRADPEDAGRLPLGTWSAASAPVGVRLSFVGDATAVAISYRREGDGRLRDDGTGLDFEAWSNNRWLRSHPAEPGTRTVRVDLEPGRSVVYLPERVRPVVLSVAPIGGSLEPGPDEPRWLAYGDSIVEGWSASRAGLSWPARLGRSFGLEVCNMGYAGSARGEIATAEQLAALSAEVISISYGTNCWSTIPHDVPLLAANCDAFLRIVRAGHPQTPIVVSSPVVRPGAETTPNRLGATLAELRDAMEAVVLDRIGAGDDRLVLAPGLDLLDGQLLHDGIHPGDDGHAMMAERLGPVLWASAFPEIPTARKE